MSGDYSPAFIFVSQRKKKNKTAPCKRFWIHELESTRDVLDLRKRNVILYLCKISLHDADTFYFDLYFFFL